MPNRPKLQEPLEEVYINAHYMTREGRHAYVLATDVVSEDRDLSVLALVDTGEGFEKPLMYNKFGRMFATESPHDLIRCDPYRGVNIGDPVRSYSMTGAPEGVFPFAGVHPQYGTPLVSKMAPREGTTESVMYPKVRRVPTAK